MKEIPLTQGKFAKVDDEDFERVNQFKWCAVKRRDVFYAIRSIKINGKWTKQYMHRFITNAKPGKEVDHENNDGQDSGLDNRKSNLRFCTRAQNLCNQRKQKRASSKYKGVYWQAGRKKWRAQIQANGRKICLGVFDSEEEAARTYDRAALKLFGEFARLNLPEQAGG